MRKAGVVLVLSCGLLVCGGGIPGTGSAAGGEVTVTIEAGTYPGDSTSAPTASTLTSPQSFTLTCNPTGGTLPFAERICNDIQLYPRAMLNPQSISTVCGGSPDQPPSLVVFVGATSAGVETSFSGAEAGGFCQPGGVGPAVYLAATQQDEQSLDAFELRLRCDEDSALFVLPRPFASIHACMSGLWTPASEQLIHAAQHVHAIAVLQPASLFPADIGAQRCTIPNSTLRGKRTLKGDCGVYVNSKTQTVSFVEDWPVAGNRIVRHVWHVAVRNGKGTLTSQTGPVPPQLKR